MNASARGSDGSGRVSHTFKPGQPPALGFERIDGEDLGRASAGMGDMIAAAADRAPGPGVDDVEREGHVGRNGRVQA